MFLYKRRLQKGLAWLSSFLPTAALADGDDQQSTISVVLQKLVDLLGGNIAHLCSVLAIMAVGFLWLGTGQMPKKAALGVIIGIAIINGAVWLGSYFWGAS